MRRALTLFLAGAVLVGLTSCKPAEQGVTSIRSQALVMATPWERISPAETRVSIVGDDPVLDRRARWEPARRLYSEAMQLANGQLLFERRKRVPEGQALPPREELLKRYATSSLVQRANLRLSPEAVRTLKLDNGELAYVAGQGELACAVFFMYSNQSSFSARDGVDPQYQAVAGSVCEPAGGTKASQVEAAVVDLAGRVRFDEGRHSRTKIFAAALQMLREKPLDEDIEPAAVPGDRSPPYVIAPASLRTDQPVAVIEGMIQDVSPLKEARLSGQWVHVLPDGRFRLGVPVDEGANRLPLVAIDLAGNKVVREVVVERQGGAPDQRPLPQRLGRYHALIIGVKTYQAPIPSLETPIADATVLAKILEQEYGFSVTTLLDAGKAEIYAALRDLQTRLTQDDNLLIYYAGHGILDPQTDLGYWLPADARADDPANWISNTHVARLIRAIPARHVVVVADACYSGSFTRERDLLADGSGRVVPEQTVWLRSRTAFSSGELEEVLDEGGGNHSLFAMHLLNTLRRNAGIVSGVDLSAAVRRLVRSEAAQTPQYGAVISAGHDAGSDFLFIRRNPPAQS